MAACSLLILSVQRGISIALPYKEPLGLELSTSEEKLPKTKHNPYA